MPLTNRPDQPVIETARKHSPFGAMISRTLPKYRGPYPVGVCDVELPVPRETFGTFRHKSIDEEHGSAGISLETVLYSIYYPTTWDDCGKRVVWFPNPWQTIDGFIRMSQRTPNFLYRAVAYPLIAAAIYGTTFPAKPNSPLRKPPEQLGKWPLVIFSHGVGCSRLMYSTYCGEMASQGYIVCAIEHRDGTSPWSQIVSEDGQTKSLNWLQWSDLYWPELPKDKQPEDDTTLRHSQLQFRLKETYHVINSMVRLSQGEDIPRTSLKVPDFDWALWHGAVDANKPIMIGHSLGGSVAILAGADSRFNFRGIIAFDPAIQRLEPWSSTVAAPLLVINSEEFKKCADHRRLENLATFARQFAGSFHISGSTHPSFSDVFLIIPSFINRLIGLRIAPNRVFTHSLRVVLQFLNGASAAQLSEAAKHHTLEDFVEDIAGTYAPQNGIVIAETPIVQGVAQRNG